MKFHYALLIQLFWISAYAQDAVLPLRSNPKLLHSKPSQPAQIAASRYNVEGNLLIESNILQLPFLDDFSSNKLRARDFPENYIFDSIENATGPCLQSNLITVIEARFHVQQSWNYSYNVNTQQIDSTPKNPIVFKYYASTGTLCLNGGFSTFQFYPEYYTYTFNTSTGAKIDSQLVVNDTINPDTLIEFAPIIYRARLADEWQWTDNYAFVNNTNPIFPPTIGVATLDCINENGRPYDPFISPGSYGSADVLTSKPINLGGLKEEDSLYLSFFYQPMGLCDFPNMVDSLIVEFRNEYTGKWDLVWRRRGYSAQPKDTALDFKQVLVPFPRTIVPVQNYFYNGFQFRFRNKGSITGNNDHWHIDYVKLDKNRSINDTIINDIAFINPISTILDKYYTMPADQFIGIYDLSDTLNLYVRNLNYYNNNAPATNFEGIARELYPSNSIVYTAALQTFNAGYSNTISRNPKTDFTLPPALGSADSVSIFINEWITPNDILPANDSVSATQVFFNELAYDDGTAEKAYGLIGTGGLKKMAYEFPLNKPDTLTGFKVLFTNIDENVESLIFQFNVWDTITLNKFVPDVPIWTSANTKPQYIDSVNGFAVYRLDTALIVSNKIYFGWAQTDERNIQIGYDRNSPRGCDHIYLFTNAQWKKSTICQSLPGSPMIHLLFGDESRIQPTAIKDLRKESFDVLLYPNPALNTLNIQSDVSLENATLNVFDLLGRKMHYSVISNNILDISSLPQGIYFLEIGNQNSSQRLVKRFIKQ